MENSFLATISVTLKNLPAEVVDKIQVLINFRTRLPGQGLMMEVARKPFNIVTRILGILGNSVSFRLGTDRMTAIC